MQKQTKAYLFALIAIFFWSTVGTAFKLSLEYVDFLNLLFYSCLTSLVIFAVILTIQKKWLLIKKVSRREIIVSAINGLLNPFLYYYILFQAYDILLAQEALTLNYLWPVALVLLSIPILKQKIGLISIIAITISFFGSYIIATGGDIFGMRFTSTKGVILALSSTIIWALFWILNIRDKREEVSKMFLNFSFGFLYITGLILISGKLVLPNIYGIVGVAYVGTFEMGITFIFWLKALNNSKTTAKVSNLIYIAPFISLIFINIILGESLKTSTFIGLIFIIAGIFTEQYFAKKTITH